MKTQKKTSGPSTNHQPPPYTRRWFKQTCHMVFLNTWETDNGYLWQLHGGQCENGIGSMVKKCGMTPWVVCVVQVPMFEIIG